MLPATSSSPTANSAAPAAQAGTGVDARDLPAVLRVVSLPEEAVNNAKMQFPGTYDRFGKVTEEALSPVEQQDQETAEEGAAGESDDEAESILPGEELQGPALEVKASTD
ncbi:MAG: hypothetical protein VX498_01085 [Myxococcota bacterium]|nr:hypothetical protein [Myxococcota bacterium]